MAGKVDLKVVLLGKEFGGKTSLVERYIHNKFSAQAPYQSTIGAAFGAKKLTIGGESVTLGIWDTAGSERYESMSRIYYRGAKAAIVCFDLTDGSSFERAKFWVNELKQSEEGCSVHLCGTKFDLVETDKKARKVDVNTAKEYADEISAKYLETSSKTGHNIELLFMTIAEEFIISRKDKGPEPGDSGPAIQLEPVKDTPGGCKC
eukprot:Em0013g1099a